VCRVAAGQRLLEIRERMGVDAWARWIAGGQCPVIAATAAAYVAAAEIHAEQVREPA